jgi:hypothetical protein
MQIDELAARSNFTLVLDENLAALYDALRDFGFKVLSYPKGLKDSELVPFLTNKILITNNSKDFIIDALVHDFDIIGTESVKFIDDRKDRKNVTASKIAKAIRESNISLKRGNWLMVLMDDGSYKLKELR